MEDTVKSVHYKTGKYNFEDLKAAKDNIKKGVTYSKAIENRNISRMTLHAQ